MKGGNEEEESIVSISKSSEIKGHMANIIAHIEFLEVFAYYKFFRHFRSFNLRKKHSTEKQLKLEALFHTSNAQLKGGLCY